MMVFEADEDIALSIPAVVKATTAKYQVPEDRPSMEALVELGLPTVTSLLREDGLVP